MRHKQDQGGTQLIPPAGALQKCSGKATKPGAEQAWTGQEIPDVWGGLRGCPVVKLHWSCPGGKQGIRGHRMCASHTGPRRPPSPDRLRRKSAGKPHENPGSFQEAGSLE